MRCGSAQQSASPNGHGGRLRVLQIGVLGGALTFVALTGCAVWLLPFGTFTQVGVLVHAIVGVIATAAAVHLLLTHWLVTRKDPGSVRKIFGYIGFWLLALSVATGLIVSWQALFGRYVGRIPDWLHLWSGVIALPFLAYHVLGAHEKVASAATEDSVLNGRVRRDAWIVAFSLSIVLFASFAVAALYYARVQQAEAGRHHVGDSDFRPSMAETESGRPIPVEVLAGSDSCGTADCHASIYQEWKSSAHRWSAEDQFFQEVRTVTTSVKGVHETEKCAACHDPVSMLSGHKDPMLGRTAPGFKEGDSCVVCHAVKRVDERGIGSYVMGAPQPYLYDGAAGRYRRAINHFLIRAYPGQHNRDYDLTLLRKPESCAPCHKEFDVLNEQEGPVQVETQFDDWKRGKWNTDPDSSRRLYCQQCHMYRVVTSHRQADPYDLKARLGFQYRSHSFAAGNQYMPGALSAHNVKAHTGQVEEWLRGERAVNEIEKVWPRGPIVELKITAPAVAKPGDTLPITVTLSNRKVGHSFPTGPLNIARAWIELVVEDASGRQVFHSGLLDAQNHIEAGSYVLKPLAINTAGQMILKPDLWHPVGPKFRRAVLAGESDAYEYVFRLPPRMKSPLTVKARLRYSKANQFFMDAVYPDSRREAPITDISSASSAVELR